ncbi:MAG: hypothetical protein O7A04_03495 [Acidobacteria bacterium]|nr:hypothetical protein [Acidobacteriota bacterium]
MSERRLAILGAGPTGIEAALAAADRGWSFELFEASAAVGDNISDWGHVRLFTPWSLNVSPRMRRHLDRAGLPAPDDETCPTGSELRQRVLLPLAASPAMAPNLRLGARVVDISRTGLLKHEEIGTAERGRHAFRLLVRDSTGQEEIVTADTVLDCTGSYSLTNWVGDGGIPAPGETAAARRIFRRVPDLVADADDWRGLAVLLIGAGYSAQTAVEGLARLAAEDGATKVVWALRSVTPQWQIDPQDPLPERSRLTAAARELAAGSSAAVDVRTGVVVERLAEVADGLEVTLRRVDGECETVTVDRLLGLTGSVGDHTMYRQLQVHECYATCGPMKLAAALLGAAGGDCLTQESHGAETLINPEPGFFILGSKSYGRNATFLMRVGWQQVEEVFSLLEVAG